MKILYFFIIFFIILIAFTINLFLIQKNKSKIIEKLNVFYKSPDLNISNILNLIKKAKINNLVVWGLLKSNHTHRYIHSSIYKAFKYIKYKYKLNNLSVLWLEDNKYSKLPEKSIVFSSPHYQTDKYLPILNNCYYILHYTSKTVNSDKVITKYDRLLKLKKAVKYKELRNSYHKGKKYHKIKDFFYYYPDSNMIEMPWATNLNPDEINRNILNISKNKLTEKINRVGFVGTIWKVNENKMMKFKYICKKYNYPLVIKKGLTDDENEIFIRQSKIAPAIQGESHIGEYIPCRIFKNISYGAIPITNNHIVYELFNKKIIYNSDISRMLEKALSYNYPYKRLIEIMNDVMNNHTYVSRLDTLTKYLNI